MSRKPVPKVAFTKPPTSLSDQIRLLQQRGLVISDGPKAEFYLAQLNYYRFAAYCLPMSKIMRQSCVYRRHPV